MAGRSGLNDNGDNVTDVWYGLFIFQTALKANASSVILAHNHPSGNEKPSEGDIQLIRKLRDAGKLLEISVLDHLILLPEGYTSFADDGLI